MKKLQLILFLLTCLSFCAQSKKVLTPAYADSLFKAGNWEAGAKVYTQLSKGDPKNGRYFYRLGFCYHNLKHYENAIQPYRNCIGIAGNNVAMYNLACVFARLHKTDSAIGWLDKSIAAGFIQKGQITGDADLESLKDEPRFKELVNKITMQSQPCRFDPKYREFDFWIGEWNVYDLNGNLAGHSKIDLILDDCIILENWTSTLQGSGKSFNTYNAAEGKWRQTWVDSQGSFTEFKNGEFKENKMQFVTGNVKSPKGYVMQRLTFFHLENGNVRQFGEASVDEGKTWSTGYDLLYKKISPVTRD